ncbi:hypothetical protein KIN20_034762 [Parelaphostrongylus tenuis]|uniref:Uncharacterized protein n=1 Tax=Parelaphostrongylus tenuis TaxID=148309 RepID=A0AAD5WJX6_PARTN|nr:hypothetical protein KIN20_034762 [Parelaphostrongylus tenuis]
MPERATAHGSSSEKMSTSHLSRDLSYQNEGSEKKSSCHINESDESSSNHFSLPK